LNVPKEDRKLASADIPMMRGSAKNHIDRTSHKIQFTEKCDGRDSPLCCDASELESDSLVRQLVRSAKPFLALLVCESLAGQAALAEPPLGAQGPEGEPNREQQWRVPTPDADVSAHAVLFRPQGEGPFRLALIAHATTQNVLRRAQMPQPEYRALAAFLVARGFAVLVPERLGHGVTGGKYLEDQGGCDDADSMPRALPPMRSHCRWNFCAPSPSSGKTVPSLSAIRPAAGGRWRWPVRMPRTSRPSSHLRPGAAATPMIFPIRSARRTRLWLRRASLARLRACR
jgi:hypothetical protein